MRNEITPTKQDKRPIAKFYRCWMEDLANGVSLEKRRGINQDQYRAADRLAYDYQLVFSGGSNGRGFIEIHKLKTHRPRNYSPESQIQAMHDYQKVISQLGRKSREIIKHFCLQEFPIRQFELKQVPKWPKGVGTARLREALDDLILNPVSKLAFIR